MVDNGRAQDHSKGHEKLAANEEAKDTSSDLFHAADILASRTCLHPIRIRRLSCILGRREGGCYQSDEDTQKSGSFLLAT